MVPIPTLGKNGKAAGWSQEAAAPCMGSAPSRISPGSAGILAALGLGPSPAEDP